MKQVAWRELTEVINHKDGENYEEGTRPPNIAYYEIKRGRREWICHLFKAEKDIQLMLYPKQPGAKPGSIRGLNTREALRIAEKIGRGTWTQDTQHWLEKQLRIARQSGPRAQTAIQEIAARKDGL